MQQKNKTKNKLREKKNHLPHSMLDTEFCRTKTCVYKGNNLEKGSRSFLNRHSSKCSSTSLLVNFLFVNICKLFHKTPILKIHHFSIVLNYNCSKKKISVFYESIFHHLISVPLSKADVYFCFFNTRQENLSLLPPLKKQCLHCSCPHHCFFFFFFLTWLMLDHFHIPA